MKILAILASLILMAIPGALFAQSWFPANQVTIAWDPVTTVDDSTPIPLGQTITYTIFTRSGTIDGPISEGTTIPTTQALIGFSVPGRYYIGIKANLMDGTAKLTESSIAWSYEATAVQGGKTFGIIFSRLPSKPANLRIIQ